MPHDIKEVHDQQSDSESRSESGKSNPTHGADQDSSEKKNKPGRENQPNQQPPTKNVHGEEHEHRKAGNK